MNLLKMLAGRVGEARSSEIDELFRLTRSRLGMVSLAAGAPDDDLLPVNLIPLLVQRAIDRYGASILQYGSPSGFDPLRVACGPLLAERGIAVRADDIHIATGGSGGLDTLCMALLDDGDTVLVERPTYSLALKVFRTYGARVEDVECDEYGMLPGALDVRLRTGGPVKFVYLLPTFQNPTGRTMPASRRMDLAHVLREREAIAIEDDVYWQLRYEAEPISALWRWAPDNVVYLTSLSKTLAPAIRIGIVVPLAPLYAPVLALKQGIDMHTSLLSQAVASEFLTSTEGADHVQTLIVKYRQKRDILLAALDARLPSTFSWSRPSGGMFVWLTAPDRVDTSALLPSVIAANLAYQPGGPFHVNPGAGRSTLRLGFAGPAATDIEASASRLTELLIRAAYGD